jgi:hypothetical protein
MQKMCGQNNDHLVEVSMSTKCYVESACYNYHNVNGENSLRDIYSLLIVILIQFYLILEVNCFLF